MTWGVPEQVEFPAALAAPPASGQLVDPVQVPQSAQPAIPSSVPNGNPLDLFPQVLCLPPSFLILSSFQTHVQFYPQALQMLLQMQVVEFFMFCETTHNSEVCFPWCRLTLKSCSFFFMFLLILTGMFIKQISLICSLCFKNWGKKIHRSCC